MARIQAKKVKRERVTSEWNSGDILVYLVTGGIWLYIAYLAVVGLFHNDYAGVLMLAVSGILGMMVFKTIGRKVSGAVIVFSILLGIFGFLWRLVF